MKIYLYYLCTSLALCHNTFFCMEKRQLSINKIFNHRHNRTFQALAITIHNEPLLSHEKFFCIKKLGQVCNSWQKLASNGKKIRALLCMPWVHHTVLRKNLPKIVSLRLKGNVLWSSDGSNETPAQVAAHINAYNVLKLLHIGRAALIPEHHISVTNKGINNLIHSFVRPKKYKSDEKSLTKAVTEKNYEKLVNIMGCYSKEWFSEALHCYDKNKKNDPIHRLLLYAIQVQLESEVFYFIKNNLLLSNSLIQDCIKYKANLNLKDRTGKTPLQLMICSDMNGEYLTRLLTNSIININQKLTPGGYNATHFAAAFNKDEFLQKLIATGKCNINAQTNEGHTPLTLAIITGAIDCIKTLLKCNVDAILYYFNDKDTLLHFTIRANKPHALNALLQHNKIPLNSKNAQGNTPLILATRLGFTTCVEIMLEHKASVNEINNMGETALHWAASKNYSRIIELLHLRGADINAQCSTKGKYPGYTPLHFAVKNGHEVATRMLLSYSADPSIKTKNGKTADYLAKIHNRNNIITLLNTHQNNKK
jgi:ankyrin repeat protein